MAGDFPSGPRDDPFRLILMLNGGRCFSGIEVLQRCGCFSIIDGVGVYGLFDNPLKIFY